MTMHQYVIDPQTVLEKADMSALYSVALAKPQISNYIRSSVF